MLGWTYVAVAGFCLTLSVKSADNNNKVTIRINEEDAAGSIVANMARIFSLRYDERPERTFKLLSQKLVARNPNKSNSTVKLVILNQATGVIALSRKLDREELCRTSTECIIRIQAVMLPHKYFNLLNLDLVVQDINDNRPVFVTKKLNVTINEDDVTVNDVINIDKYQAYDRDIGVNGKLSYELSKNSYFTAVQSEDEAGTAHLHLKVIKTPDHELVPELKLTLTATDGGEDARSDTAVVYIHIEDANDHDPMFDQQEYVVNLEENLEASSLIATLRAVDQDSGDYGLVRYFIPSSTLPDNVNVQEGEELIAINEHTGEVRLKQKLDREKHDGIRILVEARDSDPIKQRVGKTWLIIHVEDVNDNAPAINVNFIIEFRNGTAYISESDEARTYMAYVGATDADNGLNGDVQLKLRTFGKNKKGVLVSVKEQFVLAPGGLIATGRPLDREVCQDYVIEIKACDQGTPQRCTKKNVTVVVLDINDYVPKFENVSSKRIVRLAEDSDVGTVVTKVTAYDGDSINGPSLWKSRKNVLENSRNGIVKYSIVEGDRDYFNVDSNSGEIFLNKKLDHEQQNKWKLVIQARDGGKPTSYKSNCTVEIRVDDINDNPPVFMQPNTNDTEVYATILHDQLIMKVKAQDLDHGANSRITYNIVKEDGILLSHNKSSGIFVINPVTGELRLNFSNPNMTDTLGWHSILIKASDFGFFSLSSSILVNVKVTQKVLPNPIEEASLDKNFILIACILAALSFLLILAIILVLCVRRRRRKSFTYNCRTAETTSKAWRASKQTISNGRSDELVEKYSSPDKEKLFASNEIKNARNDVHQRYDIVVTKSNKEQDENNQTEMVTFKTTEKTNRSLLVLPVAPSYTDRDSGRGDSDQENGTFEHNEDSDTQDQFKPVENESDYKYEIESNQTSELGPRCDQSCLEYGHSDTCWMPSPTKDPRYSFTLPHQRISHPDMTSSTPHLELCDSSGYGVQYPTEYPTLQHYQTMSYYIDPHSGYYSSPVPSVQPPVEYYYHGYGSELGTIEEMAMDRSGSMLNTADDHDVSEITHATLTGRTADRHRESATRLDPRDQAQYQNRSNWKTNYYNPPTIQRVMLPHEDPTFNLPSPTDSARLSACSSETSSSRRNVQNPHTRRSIAFEKANNLTNETEYLSPLIRKPNVNTSAPRLTPLPQLNGRRDHTYYPYHNEINAQEIDCGNVTIQEAREIVNDIDKLLVR